VPAARSCLAKLARLHQQVPDELWASYAVLKAAGYDDYLLPEP
jgi:hypothetical protein